ncbi:MAG: hypothetical protein ISR82_01405 [Candidatus Marinimicrobia bacterium]|nr:hypothetical protein [Candidatus Neomarinimicrobiota bacterium]MBL7009863.1 hypothetical protein [Candidatus Neomarinimicrobiota bacterium]MBL7030186.1 hypothetical protein [Candidatus Neomarinimicrobiota bacterium]
MKVLALFTVVIVVIGCLNDNSVCTYEGVDLDTNQIAVISNQVLAGEWKLISFIDLSDCSVENEPVGGFLKPEVVISFEDSLQLSGHTTNKFYGSYTLLGKKINMSVNSISYVRNFLYF